jgi:hypothetical protein
MKGISLGLAHELGLMMSVVAALLVVLLGGALPPWLWLAAVAPLLSMAMARRGQHVPAIAGTMIGVAAIGGGIVTLLQGGVDSAVLAGGITLVGLTVGRLLTRRTLAHDQQLLLLALVLVFAGSVLNVGLSYFLLFVAFAIATVWALSTRQLLAGAEETGASAREARDRTDVVTPLFFAASGAVSLVVLAAAVGIFAAFPRIGFGELGFLSRRNSQLPQSVGFSSDPRGLSTSTEVVARVRGVPLEQFNDGLYLRAMVYDVVTWDAFSQSSPTSLEAEAIDRRANLPQHARGTEVNYDVVQMPIAGPLVFTLGHTRTAIVEAGGAANPNRSIEVVGRNRHDELRAAVPLASPLRFKVRGSVMPPGEPPAPDERLVALDDAERRRYLEHPKLDDEVTALLARVIPTTATTDVDVATALRANFLRTFTYTLDSDVRSSSEPLRAFLLRVRAGHCELFAGAYALLLRSRGIPARVVGGFQGGALDDDGTIVFQQRHAHAWVEWWKDGVGWIVDDATPQAMASREHLGGWSRLVEAVRVFWDDRVIDFSLQDQTSALRGISNALRGKHLGTLLRVSIVGAVVAAVGAAIFVRLRRRQRRAHTPDKLARDIIAAAVRLGLAPPPAHWTIADVVTALPHPLMQEAQRAYEQHRYGNIDLPEADVRQLQQALRRLQPAR